jgi:hypothetical protein
MCKKMTLDYLSKEDDFGLVLYVREEWGVY